MKKTYSLNGFSDIHVNDIVVCHVNKYRVASKSKLLQHLSKRFGLDGVSLIDFVNRFTKSDVIGILVDDIITGTNSWNNSNESTMVLNNEKIVDIVSPEGVSKKIIN